jgi:ATP-dependent DNA helicase RecG
MYDIFFQQVKSLLHLSEPAQKALARLKIVNLRYLVFYKPVAYNLIKISPDLAKVKNGDLIQAEVIIDDVLRPSSKRSPLKIKVSNATGTVILVFFSKNSSVHF